MRQYHVWCIELPNISMRSMRKRNSQLQLRIDRFFYYIRPQDTRFIIIIIIKEEREKIWCVDVQIKPHSLRFAGGPQCTIQDVEKTIYFAPQNNESSFASALILIIILRRSHLMSFVCIWPSHSEAKFIHTHKSLLI